MYNHNKAQQSKNRVHISWDILYGSAMKQNSDIEKQKPPLDRLFWGLIRGA